MIDVSLEEVFNAQQGGTISFPPFVFSSQPEWRDCSFLNVCEREALKSGKKLKKGRKARIHPAHITSHQAQL